MTLVIHSYEDKVIVPTIRFTSDVKWIGCIFGELTQEQLQKSINIACRFLWSFDLGLAITVTNIDGLPKYERMNEMDDKYIYLPDPKRWHWLHYSSCIHCVQSHCQSYQPNKDYVHRLDQHISAYSCCELTQVPSKDPSLMSSLYCN